MPDESVGVGRDVQVSRFGRPGRGYGVYPPAVELPSHPWVDASAAPLLVQRYPPRFTDDELAAGIAAIEAVILAQDRPFAWVAELDHLVFVPMRARRRFAEFEQRVAEHDRRYCVGAALVFHSPLVRSVVSSLYWIAPPVYPYAIFADVVPARRWAEARLAEAARG